MLGSDSVHLRAILIFLTRQAQKVADLIERKSQIPATANEPQAAHVFVAIGPVVSRRAGWNRQKPDLLVIPDRHNLGSGPLRQVSNANPPVSVHCLTL